MTTKKNKNKNDIKLLYKIWIQNILDNDFSILMNIVDYLSNVFHYLLNVFDYLSNVFDYLSKFQLSIIIEKLNDLFLNINLS
jgi:DNA phosphorothioation-dependent restriction protein DptG